MRLNAPPPPVFTVPDATPPRPTEAIRPVAPVAAEGRGSGAAGALPQPPAQPAPAPQRAEASTELGERRGGERRERDRRQRQIPVLLDTRSGTDRRRARRRRNDEYPPSVDTKV
jgi:hypothetical protein